MGDVSLRGVGHERNLPEEVDAEENIDPAASASLRVAAGGISDEPVEFGDGDDDLGDAASSADPRDTAAECAAAS